MPRKLAVAIVLGGFLAGAACSSGTTKAGFIQAAAPVCATANNATGGLPTPPANPSVQQAEPFYQAIIRVTQSLYNGLKGLKQPPSDPQLNAIYADLNAMMSNARQIYNDLQSGDLQGAQSLRDTFINDVADAQSAFTAYGLTACGQSS